MILTEEMIKEIPLISENENNMFYDDGELEAVVLADFNKAADKIDSKYNNGQNDLIAETGAVTIEEFEREMNEVIHPATWKR